MSIKLKFFSLFLYSSDWYKMIPSLFDVFVISSSATSDNFLGEEVSLNTFRGRYEKEKRRRLKRMEKS